MVIATPHTEMHTWVEARSRKRMRNVDAKFADGAKAVNAMYKIGLEYNYGNSTFYRK